MSRRRGQVLVGSLALLVLLLAAGSIVYVLWGGEESGKSIRAQVTGTLLTVVLIVPPAVGWAVRRLRGAATETSTGPEVEAAADRLAEQALETWSAQVVQRGIQAPAPVRVRWHWATDEVAVPRQELMTAPPLVTDPGPLPPGRDDVPRQAQVLNSGLVTRLHDEVYSRLEHGRLVLIGGPGAGKTGAMILLLLEALRHRQRVPDAARSDVPVPVWLTLGSWDPSVHGLREWVTATMSRDHPYLRSADFGPNAVPQLFDSGRIALFLDGLDEMPDVLRGKALERLAAESHGRRLVITSRPGEFREAIDSGRRQLPYTAVIDLRPVGPKAAAGYLLEGQIGPTRLAWQSVSDHLLAEPDGVLAQTLNTPLTLSLARAAYTAADPRELLGRRPADAQELRLQLLDQIVAAAYPEADARAHATYWLGWLAHRMATGPNGPTRDLRWWQIPSWLPRWQIGLVAVLVGGLSVGICLSVILVIIDAATDGSVGLSSDLRSGGVFALFGALMVGMFGILGIRAAPPRSMAVRRPKMRDLRTVRSMVVRAGIAMSLVSGLFALVVLVRQRTAGLTAAFLAGLIAVLVGGIAGGLLLGIPLGIADSWRIPLAGTSDVTPRLVHQRDVRSHVVSGAVGVLVGAIAGAVLGILVGPRDPLAFALWYGLLFGLTFGVVNGLVTGFRAGAAPSLLFTQLVLRARGLPVRFIPLLEGALDRQVLRQAGTVYQFRHADLQDRLADRYAAGLTPR
jgi:hypothetical protein